MKKVEQNLFLKKEFRRSFGFPTGNSVWSAKIVCGILFFLAGSFLWAEEGFSQGLDDALADFVRQTVINSATATVVFTSTEAVSTGSFDFDEEDERGDTRFDITRVVVRHFFSRFRDSEYAPFVLFGLGYFEDKEKVLLGGDPPDESRFKALSLSLGGGVRLELVDEHLWLTPEIDLIYGRTSNDHDYRSWISQEIFKPLFEGVLFNWHVDTLTCAPALELTLENDFEPLKLGFDTRLTYLNLRTIRENRPEHEVKSDSTLWKNRLRFELPLGISLFHRPLSLRGDFSRVELGGDVALPLKETHFYEAGMELAIGPTEKGSGVQSFWVGAGHTFSRRINGWSFRLGLKF